MTPETISDSSRRNVVLLAEHEQLIPRTRTRLRGHAAADGGLTTPLVLLHGFMDTARTWELVLPALERSHPVLAPNLSGHASGPRFDPERGIAGVLDTIEAAMDEAGFETAHVAGNSLGGYLALQLAARGRARSVVALAPAGGWAPGDDAQRVTQEHFLTMQDALETALPHVDAIVSTPAGRRRATAHFVADPEHIPPELLAHLMRGAAACPGVSQLVAHARTHGWNIDAERIGCPVRVVWGTEDRLLEWPSSAVRYRDEWLPQADWVVLDDVGHCPQLDVPLETAQLILGVTG
jgi:pimeloyl-ACP methyl ester carboxylesterase